MSHDQGPAKGSARASDWGQFQNQIGQAREAAEQLLCYAVGQCDEGDTRADVILHSSNEYRRLRDALESIEDDFPLDRPAFEPPPGKVLVNRDDIILHPMVAQDVRALLAFCKANGYRGDEDGTVYDWALERLKSPPMPPAEPGKAWVQVSEADAATLRAGGVVLPKPEYGDQYIQTHAAHHALWTELAQIIRDRPDHKRGQPINEVLLRLAKEPPIDAAFGAKLAALRKQAESCRIAHPDETGSEWIERLANVLSWIDTAHIDGAAHDSRKHNATLWPATAGRAGA